MMAWLPILTFGLVFAWTLYIPTDARPQPEQCAYTNPLIRVPIHRNPYYDHMTSIKRLARRDMFQTKLYNDEASQYLIEIGIGTPTQTFTVTLDTGSADLWVPSVDCPVNQCPYSRFNESSSSTYQTMSDKFNIAYGIGSANGTYAKDTVSVAGVSVQNQQFAIVISTSQILTNVTTVGPPSEEPAPAGPVGNGILGLGYPQLTSAGMTSGSTTYNPFVFNLAQQKLIQDPIFSIYMNKAEEDGWVGEIVFGGTDPSKYTGTLVYLPVAEITTSENPFDAFGATKGSGGYLYWMVYGQGISVVQGGKTTFNHTFNSVSPFVLDTGTTLSYLPENVATDIVNVIAEKSAVHLDPQSQTYIVNCQDVLVMNLTIQLQMSASNSISENPVTLSVPISETLLALDSKTIQNASSCILGIAPFPTDSENAMYLIGDSVLRSAYLVFDMGQKRVGLAAADHGGGTVYGLGLVSLGQRMVSVGRVSYLVMLFTIVLLIG